MEAYWDEFYRGRLRALQAVDELVEEVVNRLEELGQLDNAYIFYTCQSPCRHGSFCTNLVARQRTTDSPSVPTVDSPGKRSATNKTSTYPSSFAGLASHKGSRTVFRHGALSTFPRRSWRLQGPRPITSMTVVESIFIKRDLQSSCKPRP